MVGPPKLTPFQNTCLSNLKSALARIALGLGPEKLVPDHPQLGGENSVFVNAIVLRRPIEIWIYANEAMFADRGRMFRFEWPDYDSPNDLAASFVSALIRAAEKEE